MNPNEPIQPIQPTNQPPEFTDPNINVTNSTPTYDSPYQSPAIMANAATKTRWSMPIWGWIVGALTLILLIIVIVIVSTGSLRNNTKSSASGSSNKVALAKCPNGDWTDNSIKINSISDLSGCLVNYDNDSLNKDDGLRGSIYTFDFFKLAEGGGWDDVYKVYYDTKDKYITPNIEFDIDEVDRSGYSYGSSNSTIDDDTPNMATVRAKTKENIENELKYEKETFNNKVTDKNRTNQAYLVDTDDLKIVSIINDSGDEYNKSTKAYYEIYSIVYKEKKTPNYYSISSYYLHLSIHADQFPASFFNSEKNKIEDFAKKIAGTFKKRNTVIDEL